jgi:hypothetical protein
MTLVNKKILLFLHIFKAFVVRNAGHSAGFDDHGQMRIW